MVVRRSVAKLVILVVMVAGWLLPVAPAQAVSSHCMSGTVICVDKTNRTVKLVRNGSVRLTLSARFGAPSTPTRNGTFYVYWKDRDHVSSLYHTAMPYSLFFSGGQAIHYSSDFARNGYNGASHGCVNLRSLSGAATLYNSVSVGTKVYIYWS